MFDKFKQWLNWFRPKKEEPTPKQKPNPDLKPPKMFYSKKFDSSHVKTINKAMKQNYKGVPTKITIEYKKNNGTQVRRTISPYTSKNGNLLVAYDHDRDALRSFRLDRLQSLH